MSSTKSSNNEENIIHDNVFNKYNEVIENLDNDNRIGEISLSKEDEQKLIELLKNDKKTLTDEIEKNKQKNINILLKYKDEIKSGKKYSKIGRYNILHIIRKFFNV